MRVYVTGFILYVFAAVADACISLNAKPPGLSYLSAPLGPPLPNDTVYVAHTAPLYHLALANDDGGYVAADSLENCRQHAAANGAQMFSYVDSTCIVATLNFPLCKSRAGDTSVYVQQEFLSDGDMHDHANLGDQKSSLFSTSPDVSFRIQFPTILNFEGYFTPLTFGDREFPGTSGLLPDHFVVLTNGGSLVTVSDQVPVDPACYTESSCAVPFFTSSPNVPPQLSIFHHYCGEKLTLRYGDAYHLASHGCIGCEHFPEDYPEPYCPVKFRGFAPVKIRATLVNFAGDDQCDGFTLDVVSFDNLGVRNKTSLCGSQETEIKALGGRGKIIFGGSSITRRRKYGFVITLSY